MTAPAEGSLDVGCAETGLAVLIEASERAVEELVCAVPPAQIRALLIIDRAGSLNLSRLAEALGASASAASRLCDRIQAAGLLTRDRAAASRREIVLFPTESGRRLAERVRRRRRTRAAVTPWRTAFVSWRPAPSPGVPPGSRRRRADLPVTNL